MVRIWLFEFKEENRLVTLVTSTLGASERGHSKYGVTSFFVEIPKGVSFDNLEKSL